MVRRARQQDEMPEENRKLTPYQGKRRSFGYFHCSTCNKEWTSAFSWANTYQKCRDCDDAIYPYRQHKLLKSGNPDNNKPHLRNLCQRCIETGTKCWERIYIR